MELVDRYLQAVKFLLPKKQKDDIIAELSEDIHAQIEERAAELGRELNETEVEAILKRVGPPLLVANRYLPQESLIGPVLFPIYRFVLKLVGLVYLGPSALVWISLAIFSPSFRAGHGGSWIGLMESMWSYLWFGAFVAVGAVTGVFAILERVQARSRFLENWNPRKLPPVRDPSRIPRSSSAIELAVNVAVFAWWAAKMSSPVILDQPGVRIWLTPEWSAFFWGLLVVMSINGALAGVNLIRPHWTGPRAGVRLISDLIGSALFCWIMKANIVAGIALRNVSPERAREVATAINHWMTILFPASVVLAAVTLTINIWRIVRLRKTGTPFAPGKALATALLVLLVAGGVRGQSTPPSDVEIRKLLADRIDVQHKSLGMVVGISTPAGRRITTYGRGGGGPLDGDTVFEIGSVTKVFTALLLADMVERGEVRLDDAAARRLPAGVKLPERQGRSITLVDLATQTSGLPFFPPDLPLDDREAAPGLVAKYTTPQLYRASVSL